MAIFGPKPNPLQKCQFFDFLKFSFYSVERRFLSLEYHKRRLPGLFCLIKKIGKMAIFRPKTIVIPFGKMSIFPLFELLLLIAQKGVFSFQNFVRNIFLAYTAKKKKLKKWPFLDQNHGLTPLQKCQFFDSLNFLFLQPRKVFFRSRIS